ncbi:MAG: hypothetical protein AB2L09_01560 [Coriobacteriia bacterium]
MTLNLRTIARLANGLVEASKLVSSVSTQFPQRAPDLTGRPAPSSESQSRLESRVSAIESHERDQDKLLQGLAEQLDNLVFASEQIEKRVNLQLMLSAGAVVVSLGTLLFVLLRG